MATSDFDGRFKQFDPNNPENTGGAIGVAGAEAPPPPRLFGGLLQNKAGASPALSSTFNGSLAGGRAGAEPPAWAPAWGRRRQSDPNNPAQSPDATNNAPSTSSGGGFFGQAMLNAGTTLSPEKLASMNKAAQGGILDAPSGSSKDPLNSMTSVDDTGPIKTGGGRSGTVGDEKAPTKEGASAETGALDNIGEYISANNGAGATIANRLNSNIGDSYNKYNEGYQKDINGVSRNIQGVEDNNKALNGYLGQLDTEQKGLDSFNGMADRAQFDQAGKNLQNFYAKNKTGLETDGKNLTEDFATLARNRDVTDKKFGETSGYNTNMQSDEGRNTLINSVLPSASLTDGQRRLDNALFSTDNGAVSHVQSLIANALKNVGNNQTALGKQKEWIDTTDKTKKDTLTRRGDTTNKLVQTFHDKLGSQSVFNEVNDARNANYNDYVNQFKSGNLSKELANKLGIADANGNLTVPANFKLSGNGSQGFTSSNKINSYNASMDPNQYITRSGKNASKFQDVLSQNDYNVYDALRAMAHRAAEGDAGTTGASQMGAATLFNNKLGGNLNAATNDYNKNYGGKKAVSTFSEQSSRNRGTNNDETGVNWDPNYNPHAADGQYGGARGGATYNGTLADYVNGTVAHDNWNTDVRGDTESLRASRASAEANAIAKWNAMMQPLVAESGINNSLSVSDLPSIADKYKRFGGLV